MKKGKLPLWILLYILGILLLATIVNALMGLPIPTDASLNAPTWLGFWGSYLGGAIGCIPALAALYDNRLEARRQHEESEKSRRLAAMPVIACEDSSTFFSLSHPDSFVAMASLVLLDQKAGFHDSFTTHTPAKYAKRLRQLDSSYSWVIYLDFHNIGTGPALNISLSCLNVPQHDSIQLMSIGCSKRKALLVCIQTPPEADEHYQVQYDIGITFNDIFGNQYVQIQPLVCRKKQHALHDITLPKLIQK